MRHTAFKHSSVNADVVKVDRHLHSIPTSPANNSTHPSPLHSPRTFPLYSRPLAYPSTCACQIPPCSSLILPSLSPIPSAQCSCQPMPNNMYLPPPPKTLPPCTSPYRAWRTFELVPSHPNCAEVADVKSGIKRYRALGAHHHCLRLPRHCSSSTASRAAALAP